MIVQINIKRGKNTNNIKFVLLAGSEFETKDGNKEVMKINKSSVYLRDLIQNQNCLNSEYEKSKLTNFIKSSLQGNTNL